MANVFAYDAFGTLIASKATPQRDSLFAVERQERRLALWGMEEKKVLLCPADPGAEAPRQTR